MSKNIKFRFLLVSILVAIFMNGCAGSPMETRMMSPQELTSVTNEILCRAYNFDVLWSGKDIPSLQAEVSRRMLNCSGGTNLDHYSQGTVFLNSGDFNSAIFKFRETIRINPNHAQSHNNLGVAYEKLGQRKEAIVSYKEAIRINPHLSVAFSNLGILYGRMGQYQESITYLKKSIRKGMTGTSGSLGPVNAGVHNGLGVAYQTLGRKDEAIEEYKEALRLDPTLTVARDNLNNLLQKKVPAQDFQGRQHLVLPVIGSFDKINDVFKGTFDTEGKGASRIKLQGIYSKMKCEGDSYITLPTNNPSCQGERGEAKLKCDDGRIINSDFRMQTCTSGSGEGEDQFGDMFTFAFGMSEEDAQDYLNKEIDLVAKRQKLIEERQRQAQAEKEPPPRKEQQPQSGSGSGFFVSKMGHVITNAHVVQNCNRVTIGDNANKQVPAELINTDSSNDLALLKLSTLEMASAESKSLIHKLGIVVVPLASKGLLRSEDVRLGEKVLVAGYPFGEFFSNTIKVTTGVVSATRGAGDDSGQFQLDAAVQPGNSGGPIYDSSGNIVGVVISQLDKLKVAKAIGSLPENVNFGIKASTVRQFLISSGVPSKKSERTEEKSTEQLAEIAQNQALMVMCLQ